MDCGIHMNSPVSPGNGFMFSGLALMRNILVFKYSVNFWGEENC